MPASSQAVFQKFVPKEAVAYCDQLYQAMGFEFKVKKTRKTKLGDYRYDPRTSRHTITINNDLNPYSFLITYVHEVAHLVTFKQHGRSVAPHGAEWKANFKKGLQPIMKPAVFPEPVLQALKRHLRQPKATSCSDPILYETLKQYDVPLEGRVSLRQIGPGENFLFQGEAYQKIKVRRTRALCKRTGNGRNYLISQVATVLKISS